MKAKSFSDDARPIDGDFEINIYEHDVLIKTVIEKNVIVVIGRKQMALLLGGTGITNRPLTKIGFGEGTTPADPSNTTLAGAFVKNIATGIAGTGVSYPVATSPKFTWTLENAEGNGLAITEFGLLSTDGTLFARKQFAAINKTASIRLTGTWTINL